MGMSDYDYEEALKYRYEYWEREGWLGACIETMAGIGGHQANWDMLDTVGILVGRMDNQDRIKIQDVRNKSRGVEDIREDSEGNKFRGLTPEEALKILESKKGGTVWLKQWGEDGDDYPIEDPEEFKTLMEEGEFDSDNEDAPIILNDEDAGREYYDSKMYYDGLYEIVKARLDYTREEIREAEQVIEDY